MPTGDCNDGRDNDGDGLTDVAQDPDCERGSEAGSTTSPTPGTTTRAAAANSDDEPVLRRS